MLREEAFSYVPRLRAGLFCDLPPGEFCPLRIPPFGMAAVSPRDKSRKDGALSPVTSEKASSLSPPSGGPPDASRSAGGGSLSCHRNSIIHPQRGNSKNWVFVGPPGGALTDPQPKFPRSLLDAPIMSTGAPCRPRRCRVFGSMLFWGCPVADIQNMGPFRKHGRCGCGL